MALALAAAFVGPCASTVWLVSRSGGPFDTPYSATGTFAKPSPDALAARSAGYKGYAGSVMAETTPEVWSGLGLLAEQYGPDGVGGGSGVVDINGGGGDVLVYQSEAADHLIMGGARNVLPVGGYSGSVPYPSVDQVRQLIESGTVTVAVVPGVGTELASDPRVQEIISLCRPAMGIPADSGAEPVVYDCTAQ